MVRLFSLLIAALAVAIPAVGAPPQTGDLSKPIELTFTLDSATAASGVPVTGTVVIRNATRRKLKILYEDKDIYGRPLDFPANLRLRVVDATGEVLTKSERSPEGWWSAAELLNPHLLVQRKGQNRLELKAGAEHVQRIVVGQILAGSARLGAGFPPGTYTLQASLNGVDSNLVTLDVTR